MAAVYANSLSGVFVLDDQAAIVQNPEIRDLGRLGAVLWPAPDSPVAGRPLVSLSFALNYAWGGFDVRGYHAVNIALHAVCALLAFGVLRRTLERPRLPGAIAGAAVDLAFVAVLLWAVHPLNTEVVDYTAQRSESMMAAFYLLTLAAAIRAASGHAAGWTMVAIAASALGALCKESIATVPVMVALYDRVFLYGSWREAFRARKLLYAGLAATWIIVAAIVAAGPRAAVVGPSSGVPVWTYLLNQTVEITGYLGKSLWPHDLVVFYGWPRPLTLVDVVPQALLLVSLAVATIAALVRAPALGFLGAWFFVTLAPASSLVPIATEVGAERRMYLPLLAVTALVVVAAHAAIRRLGVARPATVAVPVVVVVTALLAAGTILRNREYASGLALARTVVERRPTPVAHHILAEQLLASGRIEEALAELRASVAAGNTRAAFPLGLELFDRERLPEAIDVMGVFVATEGRTLTPRWLEPTPQEIVIARELMAAAHLRLGNWTDAADQARRVVEIAPGRVAAHRILGDALLGQERWNDAGEPYREVLRLRPGDTDTLINYGVSRAMTGDFEEAIAVFRRTLSFEPDNARARDLLAAAVEDQRRGAGPR